jgi:hypothetical protein
MPTPKFSQRYPDETDDWRLEVQKAKDRGITDHDELNRIMSRVKTRAYIRNRKKTKLEKPTQFPAASPPMEKPIKVPKAAEFKFDFSPKQWLVLNTVRERCGHRKIIFVNGPKWSGKCISPDTIIYTADGFSTMSELGRADIDSFSPINKDVVSMSETGLDIGVSRADQFYNSGFGEAVIIKTGLGYELTCSQNHPIWCEHNGEIGYKTSEEIAGIVGCGGSVWLPLSRKHPSIRGRKNLTLEVSWTMKQDGQSIDASERIKRAVAGGAKTISAIKASARTANETIHKWLKNPIEPRRTVVEIDENMGYLLGLLTGDGCYTKKTIKGGRIGFTSADEEIVSFVGKMVSGFPHSRFKKLLKYDYCIQSAFFRALLKEIGMSGKYAQEKSIPNIIVKSPVPVIVAFLQGLFDTDGTVERAGSVVYCSASKVLAKQVQDILLGLGIRSSRIFKKNKCLGAWLVSTREEDDFRGKIGFRLARKQNRKPIRERRWKVSWAAYPPSLKGVLQKLYDSRKERGVGMLLRKIHKYAINPVLRGQRALSMKMIAPLAKFINCEQEPEFQSYWMQGKIWWDKVERCSATKSELVDLCVPSTHNFIGNGFINHNTWAALDSVIDYAWRVKDATICILCESIGAGDDSGIWTKLMKRIDTHIKANYGLEWWTEKGKKEHLGARQKGASKRIYAELKNMHGGKSYFELNSLKDEREVEQMFFNRYFSFIYWSELQHSRREETFTHIRQALRMETVAEDDLIILADGNPSDEGQRSWQYKLFFEFRTATDVSEIKKPLQKDLRLIQIFIEDNPYITPEKKLEIAADYADNPDLFARFVKGEWVDAVAGGVFTDVFLPNVHCIGDLKDKDPDILVPTDGCTELVTGWDTGGRNPSTHILEPIILMEDDKPLRCFQYIDELAYVDEDIAPSEFTMQFMEKMDFWEKAIGHDIIWRHWADSSALDFKESIAERTPADEIFATSNGRIILQGVDKPHGSVAQRVWLWRRLLVRKRILISATKCPRLVATCKMLKHGRVRWTLPTKSPYKHALDSATYPLLKELWDELQTSIWAIRAQKKSQMDGESSLVLVHH